VVLRVVLAVVCLWATPALGSANCWEIVTSEDETIVATDLWQMRNRLTENSVLYGKVGRETTSIPVDEILSFTVTKGSGKTRHHERDIAVVRRDQQTVALRTDLNLFYVVNDQRRELAIARVREAVRCEGVDDSAVPGKVATSAPAGAEGSVEIAPSLALLVVKNGDVLHGEAIGQSIEWQSAYATVSFQPDDIDVVVLDCDNSKPGFIRTLAGDQLEGKLADNPVSFRLSTGQVIEIPAQLVLYLAFSGENSNAEIPRRCDQGMPR
jgi:hypothetical protein